MKIVFHERYFTPDYAWDPAAAPGRLDGIMEIINNKLDEYEIITPGPATEKDILRAHSNRHLNQMCLHFLL